MHRSPAAQRAPLRRAGRPVEARDLGFVMALPHTGHGSPVTRASCPVRPLLSQPRRHRPATMASQLACTPARACFDARRSVELAGPRRVRGLPRVCGGGATRQPWVFGYQEGDGADSIRSSRRPRGTMLGATRSPARLISYVQSLQKQVDGVIILIAYFNSRSGERHLAGTTT